MRQTTVAFITLTLGVSVLPVDAQIVTGSIVGTVEDGSGAHLAGARVTVSSPSLLGGRETVETGSDGAFRFPKLAPGEYALTAQADGFHEFHEPGILLLVGRTVRKRVVLSLLGVAENVTVVSDADWIDPEDISLSQVYDRELIANLPRPRSDLVDFLKMAPGMSPRNDGPNQPEASSMGSGTDDNLYLIDGGDATGTTQIGSNAIDAPWIGSDQIESVEIIHTGASAEYGNYQGAVVQIHTRQGGNSWRFHGAYFHDSDFSLGAGGYLSRDRLWLYGGYENRFELKGYADRLSLKLDWRIAPSLEARFGLQGGTQTVGPMPTPLSPLETQGDSTTRVPSVTFGQLTYTPNADTLVDVRASGMFRSSTYDPVVTDVPHRWDLATDVESGGGGFIFDYVSTRVPISVKLTRFMDDFYHADHELKLGVQFNHSSQTENQAYPTGVDYIDDGGPWLQFTADARTRAANVDTLTFFGEDVISFRGRGSIHAGLRFDYNRGTSPDVPALTGTLEESGQHIKGLGLLYSWANLSPRLGATLALTDDGRTLMRASWGRYLRSVFAGELSQFHPANGPETRAEWDPETADYSNIVDVFDPLGDLELDSNLRALRTDVLSIGVERQFGERSSLDAAYVYKRQSDFSGWSDIGGEYGESIALLPDGRQLTVFPLLNSPSDRRFLLTNRDDWFMRHHGLHVTFQSRWSRRWQTLVSYSGSRTRGVQSSVVLNPGASQRSSGGFVGTNLSSDPNKMTNAVGPLSNDRTHLFRAQSVGEIPRVGVLFGANFQYLSGVPWTAKYRVRLPQGRVSVFIEPQGSRRLPAWSVLDLRLSKIFRFGSDARLEILLDLFNVFDQAAPQSVDNLAFTEGFGEVRGFIQPRRTRFGVKVAF